MSETDLRSLQVQRTLLVSFASGIATLVFISAGTLRCRTLSPC